MLKLIRFVVLLIVIAGVAFTATLYSVPAEERPAMIAALKNYVWQHFGGTITEVTHKIEQIAAGEIMPLEVVSGLQAIDAGETFQQVASCGKTQTTALEKSTSAQIYRWTDEQGKVHFSDAKPGDTRNSEVMSVNYPDRKQYFKLNLIEQAANLPAFTRDKVSAEMRQVYGILSADLDLEHLRKVFLNVRIIGTQDGFQRYRQQRAPELRTNSGFYTSDNNEAVVFQGRDPDTMRAVIRHEATHVMMAGLYGATPSWFNEGLAEYFEQLQLSGQARQVSPVQYHWTHLQQRLSQQQLMPLRDYINLAPQQWYSGDLRDNYGMGWSLIYYLMSEQAGKTFLKTMMNDMAKNYCWTVPGDEYFERHYPGGFKAFEAGWKSWLAGSMPVSHRY